MDVASLARLLALAAIWGGSFALMRSCAPVLGPTLLVAGRVGVAALFLFTVARILHKPLRLRERWKDYAFLGLFNSALPFLLFAFAAKTLPASMLAILNATAPMFGGLIAALHARRLPPAGVSCGMLVGIAGVATVVHSGDATLPAHAGIAVAAGLLAALSYSVAMRWARPAQHGDAYGNAHGSMWAATLLLAPLVPFFPAHASPDFAVLAAVVALGVVCSGIAYLLYFRLIADIGPMPALTVTYLIPVFGVLWGFVFLDESIGWHTIIGCGAVLIGTALVTGFRWKSAPSIASGSAR